MLPLTQLFIINFHPIWMTKVNLKLDKSNTTQSIRLGTKKLKHKLLQNFPLFLLRC